MSNRRVLQLAEPRSIAMKLADGSRPDGYGGWAATLTNVQTLEVEWACRCSHGKRSDAEACARRKWFEHHG